MVYSYISKFVLVTVAYTFCYIGTGETGYYVLRPGENVTVPIVLSNNGNEAEFSLNIGQDIYYGNSSESVFAFFESGSSYYQLSVGENSTNGFSVLIVASENASDGAASTITVVAESILDQSNDFVSLQVTVTTLPPPEFTENVSLYTVCGLSLSHVIY